MPNSYLLDWLLDSDISIQYQVYRDLLDADKPELQERISKEGWGAKLLSLQNVTGHWGRGYYQPKWTCTHYTLLDLKNLSISRRQIEIRSIIDNIIRQDKGFDGGINTARTVSQSDVCINGMFLNFASYFGANEGDLKSIIDFILLQKMPDGGFNCQKNRKGAVHSSMHSTISVLEGIEEYKRGCYTYRLHEIEKAQFDSHEFLLKHSLFRSDKTGDTINKKFLNFCFPCRWYYDILRALDYFQYARVCFDNRMDDAIKVIMDKQCHDKRWKLAADYPGQSHFKMEKPGTPSRWITLRAIRVLKHFKENKG